MSIKKVLVGAVLLSFGLSASAQSLAELAKKEKERRENVKTKTSVPVTNSDLSKVKKKASVPGDQSPVPVQNPAAAENPEAVKVPTAVGAPPSSEPDPSLAAEAKADAQKNRAELQDKWERAKERIEYLNLKMRALQQQLYNFNNTMSKDQIQKDLADTNTLLQATVIEEARLKTELDQLPAPAAKPPIK